MSMQGILSRISLTTRLLLAAAAVALVLVVIDYVALLELPKRIASDSVEVALRENTQSFNVALREERADLSDQVQSFLDREDVKDLVRADRVEAVRPLLEDVNPDLEIALLAPGATLEGTGYGVVNVRETLVFRNGVRRSVVIYQDLDPKALDIAASEAGDAVAFALERDGVFIARGSTFPRSIQANAVNPRGETGAGTMTPVRVNGTDLHVYSRDLTQDPSYQLHALSTPRLERAALADTRSDVRNAVAGMSLATLLGLLTIALVTSRTVRTFAGRVRELADGDYARKLPVHGRDGFAELAESVNRLSHELEEQLTQLEDTAGAFLRTLETLEEGICTWDEGGNVTYWNRGAEQLTGIARERVTLDDPVVAFLHAERAPGSRRITVPVRRSGIGLVAELVVTAMPGGGVVQTFRDTTMADVLQQTQRNFMATAAHELRTPITTILGFADTLTNPDLDLTDEQRAEFLNIVRDQSNQLQQIADAFFTNHQLANERVEVSLGQTVVASAVADAITRMTRTLPDERADECAAIEVDVPDDIIAIADRRALVGVIAVLLENAVKYGHAPVRVSAERSGGSVALLVRDGGPGIDPYHQGRVFDPFYRIDVDMRSGVGGAGLGLFTARKLVEAMHGVIRLRSSAGDGSTFIIELPGAPIDADQGDGSHDRLLRLVGS